MLRSILPFKKKYDSNDDYIFPTVDPESDGPDCQKDCADCTVKFPSKLKIETLAPLYGRIKPFGAHILIATASSDWEPKIQEVKGSLAQAFDVNSSVSNQGVCLHYFISIFIPFSLLSSQARNVLY